MYVCLCNGYRDSEISEIAREGVRCAKRAYFEMGNGPRCGQCLDMAQDIIDEVHEMAASERCAPPANPLPANDERDYGMRGPDATLSSVGQARFPKP